MANLQHFTLKECPSCGGEETAVGDPNTKKWHCFNCRSNGIIHYASVTPVDDPEASEVD